MVNKDFFNALDTLSVEKGIDKQAFIETLESALSAAYKKNNGESTSIYVKLNPDRNSIRIYAVKKIVMTVEDPEKEISIADARLIKKSARVGQEISKEIAPKNFGRIAAQTARQVVLQKMRDYERNTANAEYLEKENEIYNCLITKIEGENVYVEVAEKMEGIMGIKDQISGEVYNVNDRIKVFVKKVKQTEKGPQILVSRSHVGFVRRLFENEVPELKQHVIEIKNMSRDAGGRTKMAVLSLDKQVDAVGACVGAKGSRVNAVVADLQGEKVDIIEWCENPAEYIARALSPAKALRVETDFESNSASVVVDDDKLSLAIGKDGQNVRLAARLTGWKIDVKPKSKTDMADEDYDDEYVEDYDDQDYDEMANEELANEEVGEEAVEDADNQDIEQGGD